MVIQGVRAHRRGSVGGGAEGEHPTDRQHGGLSLPCGRAEDFSTKHLSLIHFIKILFAVPKSLFGNDRTQCVHQFFRLGDLASGRGRTANTISSPLRRNIAIWRVSRAVFMRTCPTCTRKFPSFRHPFLDVRRMRKRPPCIFSGVVVHTPTQMSVKTRGRALEPQKARKKQVPRKEIVFQ